MISRMFSFNKSYCALSNSQAKTYAIPVCCHYEDFTIIAHTLAEQNDSLIKKPPLLYN